ncbi:MAG: beta-lactamase family protein, partial [Hymenobacteraceae bacterium]|nr:beta-lactamase family protein [Hymenobacteraceae bacterium]MDX5396587.1 beta-lactamase family protein [Hymenobacteraceae bacterium]MDX5512650.1 beta-lactamase family protein [Hymenobacteraceae bacterium]
MLKQTKRIGIGVLLLVILGMVMLYVTDKNYVYRAVYHNFADIDDNLIFEERKIAASANPEPWPQASDYNTQQMPAELIKMHEELGSIAFLVIKDDSLRYEKYWEKYGPDSHTNSFSMAKSIVSILVGIAIEEGKIKSVDQPVADFLPEFRKNGKKKILIRHLLTMSSGLNWDESYANPLSMTTEAYYGDNLRKVIGRLEAVEEPGQKFSYKSGDTQVLAFVVEAATGKKLAEYAEEKLWQKIGAVERAEWSVDKKGGQEKAYCCFFSNARDFARIGKLYLNNGIWNGDTLVPPAYVQASLTPMGQPAALTGETTNFYGYQWWLLPEYKGQDIFYARGILGQY